MSYSVENPRSLSRQRAWQLKHQAEGLCTQCSKPAYKGVSYCAAHLIKSREFNRVRRGHNAWKPGGVGRPPKGDPIVG